jgi:hypothetical protein
MNDEQFWKIVDQSRMKDPKDYKEQVEKLEALLDLETPGEMVEFDRILHRRRAEAHRRDLRGAAHVILGGCNDVQFENFLNWLISRGRRAYEAALKHPDTLATVPGIEDEEPSLAEFGAAPREIYEKKVGQPMPDPGVNAPDDLEGDPWDFDDEEEVRRRYPRLSAKFAKK